MTNYPTIVCKASSRPESEDRVAAVSLQDKAIVAIADGAGGSGNGGAAAELAIATILNHKWSTDPADGVLCLTEIDRRLSESANGGETTAVAVMVTSDVIVGASVGDSGAWFVRGQLFVNLTERQERKPLLGAGVAIPRVFQYGSGSGLLVVATDGLWKYTSREKILETLHREDFEAAPGALVDLVRLKSGTLQDDVAIALCRRD